MIPVHYIQTSFLGGMLAEHASARSDTPVYRHAARELLNVAVSRAGAALSRPGTMLRATLEGPAFRIFSVGSGGMVDRVVAVGAQRIVVINTLTWEIEADLIHRGWQQQAAAPNYIPWSADDLPDLDGTSYHDGLILVHWRYAPAIVRRSQTGVWLCERFSIPMNISEPSTILLHPLSSVPRPQVSATIVQTTDTQTSWRLRLRLVGSDVLYVWQNYGQDPQVWDHARNPWHRYRDHRIANGGTVLPIPFGIEWLGDAPWTSPPKRFFGVVVEVHDHSTMNQSGWKRWNELTIEFPKKINGNKPSDMNAGDVITRIFEPLVGPFIDNADPEKPLYAWPASVAVASSRLWFATGRSATAPHYLAGSSIRSFWDWWSSNASDDALGLLLSTDDTPMITQMTGLGTDLLVGTDMGVFSVSSSDGGGITPKTVTLARVTTTPIKHGPRPVQIESMAVFADSSQKTITAFSFERSDSSSAGLNIKMDDISIAVSGAIQQIRRLVSVETPIAGGGEHLVAIDADGRAWICGISKTLQVAAWTLWTFSRPVVDACTGVNRALVLLCRDADSSAWRIVSIDGDAWFDESVRVQSPDVLVPQHASSMVGIRRGDEFVTFCRLGPNGEIPDDARELIESADDEPPIEIGIPFDFKIELLPPSLDLPTGPLRHRAIRLRSIDLEWSGHATPTVNNVPVAVRPDREPTTDPEPRLKKQWGGSGTLLQTLRRGLPEVRIGREVPAPVAIHSVTTRMSVLER